MAVLPVRAEQLPEAIAERAIVIRGNIRVPARAHIVQRVICQDCQRTAVRRLHENYGNLRIDWPGRFDQVRAPDRRIHFHQVVCYAEWIRRDCAPLHVPAAVEDLARHLARAPADPCRREIVRGALHAVRNARR